MSLASRQVFTTAKQLARPSEIESAASRFLHSKQISNAICLCSERVFLALTWKISAQVLCCSAVILVELDIAAAERQGLPMAFSILAATTMANRMRLLTEVPCLTRTVSLYHLFV